MMHIQESYQHQHSESFEVKENDSLEEPTIAKTQSSNLLESFLKFLIKRGFVDNEDDQSETIHKFLEIFEQFEDEEEEENNKSYNKEIHQFETRAIFTLADFLKSLGPNEHYDISQKVYN